MSMDATGAPIGADRLGPAGDDVYSKLMEAHEGLDAQQSRKLNARLILLMANEIGDAERLRELIEAARR